MSKSHSQSGFTLIEILVALAIVALSFAVLFKIISDNLDRTRRARDDAMAAALVQSLLAQSQAGPLRPGVTDGKFANGFNWRVQVARYIGEGDHINWPVDAVRIAATVSWRDDGQIQSRTLRTMRVIPKALPQ